MVHKPLTMLAILKQWKADNMSGQGAPATPMFPATVCCPQSAAHGLVPMRDLFENGSMEDATAAARRLPA